MSAIDFPAGAWSGVEAHWRKEIQRRGKPLVDWAFAQECRERFAREKIAALRKRLGHLRLGLVRANIAGRCLLEDGIRAASAEIESCKKSIVWLSRAKADDDREWARRLEKAKEVPLWELLREKPRSKVICPFHPDKSPSLVLYADGRGHCFVCAKQVDTIAWVMQTEGLSFPDAVRRLA